MPRLGSPPVGHITLAQAGLLLKLSTERIRQISRLGFIPPPRKGFVPLVEAVQGYIAFLQDNDRRSSKVEAASSLASARQREIDLRVAERRAQLIETKEADLIISGVVGAINIEMFGFAASVTRDVPLRREIEKKLNEAFQRIDRALAAGRNALATGEAVPPADAEE